MKIVKLKGGLGNQMFQYAFAKYIQKELDVEVKIDLSSFSALENDYIRIPHIEKFRLSIPIASQTEIKSICKLDHKGNSQSLFYKFGVYLEKTLNRSYYWEPNRAHTDIQLIKEFQIFDGYWQSHEYVDSVRSILLKDFVPKEDLSVKTVNVIDQMQAQNSVFIGVRKGDYTANRKMRAHFGSFSSHYYQAAIDEICAYVKNPIFYVFSNDIAWCKKNINWGKHKVIYRYPEDQTNDFEELILMASCKHGIIVNSTFHWWGAYLIKNPYKKIVCPKNWFFDGTVIDILPDDWSRIDVV